MTLLAWGLTALAYILIRALVLCGLKSGRSDD